MGNKNKRYNRNNKKNKVKRQRGVLRLEVVVFTQSLMEIMCEYQTKYTNLFNLSKEYDHKLLDAVACEIYQRLTHLINGFQDVMNTSNFTHAYRRVYPHCDDEKLIRHKVWEINKQLGEPPRDVNADALMLTDNAVENSITYGELLGSSYRILVPIAAKIESHINNLDTSQSGPNKTIREALKKQAGSIQEILSATINETVMPQVGEPYGQMRIYGEPYLPVNNVLQSFLTKFTPISSVKSRRMFNCILLNLPNHQIGPFLKTEHTVIANVRLILRRSIRPQYRLPPFIVQKIKEFFGIVGTSESIGLNYEHEGEREGRQDEELSDDSDDDDCVLVDN